MRTRTYREIAAGASDVLKFAADLGVPDDALEGRFAKYICKLDQLAEAVEAFGVGRVRLTEAVGENTLPYLIALVECAELGEVGSFLHVCSPEIVARKLTRVLRGPELPVEEDIASNESRNTLFELNVGAKLWSAGIPTTLSEHPDVRCEIDGKEFFIECKRPFYRRSIKDQITKARRQLRDDLRAHGSVGARGVIAISVSKVLNRGDKVFVTPDEMRGREGLARHLLEVADGFRKSWSPERLGKHIVGVMFHVITPAADEGSGLYVAAQHTNIHPTAREGSLHHRAFRALASRLDAMWSADRPFLRFHLP